ncbi:hypothetical protein TEA_028045 [Camellia sinensis var. sinensis]|uniref:ABC transporter domain-containing protein n=1 Tax=Camellia sinensis var. sinensis TaxID=542762 RepID=A0A4S4CY91_CAMSN|nr:hypothetical protein TEA_028045 [Camellia sinensis var. sinensis]
MEQDLEECDEIFEEYDENYDLSNIMGDEGVESGTYLSKRGCKILEKYLMEQDLEECDEIFEEYDENYDLSNIMGDEGGKGLNLEPFPPGYVCPAIDMDRDTRCNIPSPPENPSMLQIPLPNDRATRNPLTPVEHLPDESCKKTNSCPATILLTGNNKTLGLVLLLMQVVKLFQGTVSKPAQTISNEINDELFKGYWNGNSEKRTNEIVAAYDFLNSSNKNFNVNIWYNSTMSDPADNGEFVVVRISRLVNLASNAYLEFLCGPGVKILFDFVKEMPQHPTISGGFDISYIVSTLFFSWVILQLYPVMLTSLVYEKQENLRIMMKMHGLGDGPYWTICFIYFLVISLAYMFCFVLSCSILVIAYAMVFGTGLLGSFYFGKKVDDPTFSRGWIAVMELYPGLALYRMLYEFSEYALQGSDTNACGMKWKDLNDSTNGIGVRKSPLFLLRKFQGQPSSSGKTSLISDRSRDFDQAEKADVAREVSLTLMMCFIEKVEQLLTEPDPNYAIVCDDLKKVYPAVDGNPPKLAVRGLSLALPRGECFGMLGPNGAGKTSFIKMMIGLTEPSSGTAYVLGLDMSTDMDRIYTSMGAVEESLKGVNLHSGGVADKEAGKYENTVGVVYMDEPSTGLDPASRNELWNVVMKAKRDRAILLTSTLSLSLSVVSFSLVLNLVFMLFTQAIQILFNIDFSMVSAHSMEEAEHLCDRLGIFVNGSLLCVGNAKQLKARYGGSYMFTITTPSNYEQEVDSMVRCLFQSANKTYHISGTQKFELPKHEVRIADVFQAVDDAKNTFTVQAWGLVDTTLEDVFIKVSPGV